MPSRWGFPADTRLCKKLTTGKLPQVFSAPLRAEQSRQVMTGSQSVHTLGVVSAGRWQAPVYRVPCTVYRVSLFPQNISSPL